MLKVSQKEVNKFLNELRESGQTNMFGSIPYLQKEFPELNYYQAKDLLVRWIESSRKGGK